MFKLFRHADIAANKSNNNLAGRSIIFLPGN